MTESLKKKYKFREKTGATTLNFDDYSRPSYINETAISIQILIKI